MNINKKLLLFGGKGGVGKTSCAAATSIYTASKGKKTLVISTDPAHSLSDSFEKIIENKITKIKENLDALEIDSFQIISEYKNKYGDVIKQIADEGTFFSKDDIKKFFDLSLPGMDELMALFKVIDILEEEKYDLIILDTAPAGHTIRLLEMPDLLTSYVKVLSEMRQKHRIVVKMMVGKYSKDSTDEFLEKMHSNIERVKTILKNSEKTSFIPITIAEAMGVNETERLIEILDKYSIPVKSLIINNIAQQHCDFCTSRKKEQRKYIEDIKKKFNRFDIIEIPQFPNELKGNNLEILSKVIFKEKFDFPKLKFKMNKEKTSFEKLNINNNINFLLIGGKGGVGKTSIASAIALHESKKKKTLIFSTDPANSLSDSYNIKISNKITKINDTLDALEIDANILFNKIKNQYKKEINEFFKDMFSQKRYGNKKTKIDAPYDRRVMEDLFDLAPPGIDEIMALKTIMNLISEKKYDLFILDTAPTGHAIRLLELPEIANSWLTVLIDIQQNYPVSLELGETLNEMQDTIKEIINLISNATKTEFIIVANPEAMSVFETQDLLSNLKRINIPAQSLIINKIIPDNKCDFCKSKKFEQIIQINKLKELKLTTTGVELFEKDIIGINNLEKLSGKLFSS